MQGVTPPKEDSCLKSKGNIIVQGDSPTVALRSGKLTRLFCSQKSKKLRKNDETPLKISGGTEIERKITQVYPSIRFKAHSTRNYRFHRLPQWPYCLPTRFCLDSIQFDLYQRIFKHAIESVLRNAPYRGWLPLTLGQIQHNRLIFIIHQDRQNLTDDVKLLRV